MKTLSSEELFNIAIGIEHRGIAFYDSLARSTEDPGTREVFKNLVKMERRHIHIFQDMLAESEKYETAAAHADDHAEYINALADTAVFTEESITSEITAAVDNPIKALELGIGAEKDSILFYYEMKEVIPKSGHSAVSRILNEEKTHLRLLSDLKRKLLAIKG
ncbi:MAG: ferritin family protein [Chloroflexi bacterium]|nr:ferritin family protein [Chloroflexota bacterium]